MERLILKVEFSVPDYVPVSVVKEEIEERVISKKKLTLYLR